MNQGKKLESLFINQLNNHYYEDLNFNLKKFIDFLFPNCNKENKILCQKVVGNQKADFFLKIENIVKYISLKSGSQNSIHVEKIDEFVKFLLEEKIEDEYINDLLLYHYGDDSLNGIGKKRYSAEDSKIRYKKEIEQFNEMINNSSILKKIIERFLFIGTKKNNKYVDAIYYGDTEIGT